MTCPHCQAADRLFNDRVARKELKRFRRKGPGKPTRRLLDALMPGGFDGVSLLDIGGGIGAIQHEAVARGAARVTDVDASAAYLAAARMEAGERGYAERATYVEGDFVDLAERIPVADVVTLDKVVCCYPDASILLSKAAAKSRRVVAVVWPRDAWWSRAAGRALNAGMVVARNPFRMRIHPDATVHGALVQAGFRRRHHERTGFWQVAVYERDAAS